MRLILTQHVRGDGRPVRYLGVRGCNLDRGANVCDRRAQFVRGVGHELPLLVARILESVQHVVKRAGEPTQLVNRSGEGDPAVESMRRDIGDLDAHALYRAATTAPPRSIPPHQPAR